MDIILWTSWIHGLCLHVIRVGVGLKGWVGYLIPCGPGARAGSQDEGKSSSGPLVYTVGRTYEIQKISPHLATLDSQTSRPGVPRSPSTLPPPPCPLRAVAGPFFARGAANTFGQISDMDFGHASKSKKQMIKIPYKRAEQSKRRASTCNLIRVNTAERCSEK